MQGIHGSNGLPRPYYMKPSKKKGSSPYDNLNGSINAFNTPRKKLVGYLVLLVLFGTCMFWVSQELRPVPDVKYEIAKEPASGGEKGTIANNKQEINGAKDPKDNLNNIVNAVGKADKESANVELADNLAQGSKGEKGKVVYEAPKGGIANEAPVVGSDEEKLIGTGKKSKQKGEVNGEKKKGYQAEKSSDEVAPKDVSKIKVKDRDVKASMEAVQSII